MAEKEEATTDFVLERTFAAPPETVWMAWTDPALLVRWYKPNPACQSAVLQHDLRVGGVMLYEMRFGDTPPFHYERWEFEAIEPPRRLQWRHMLADAGGEIAGNPQMPDWPRVMLTTIELEAHPEGTAQRMIWTPHEASEAEIACFREMGSKMGQGWGAGFANLGALMEELSSAAP